MNILLVLMASLLLAGCQKERAQHGDFKVLTSLRDSKIILDSHEGALATIDIMAKHDWEVLPTNGFECMPSSGTATECEAIDIRALHDNNTVDTVKLDDITFRLLYTRFVGLSVYQLPRMTVDKRSVMLTSSVGATNSVYVGTDEAFEVVYDESQPFTAVADVEKGLVLVTALDENTEEGEKTLGKFTIRLKEETTCQVDIDVYQRFSETPQTIFFNFLGTALLPYYRNNIDDVMSALSKNIQGKSRVVAFMQESVSKASLYELRYDTKQRKAVLEKVHEFILPRPYDAALLTTVLRRVVAYAPAEKYGIIFGSHGTAWIPKGAEDESATSGVAKQLAESIWQRRDDALPTRYIGDDNDRGYDIEEIREAVEANNITLEYIIYDACFMGNIESAYELRNVVKYIVGSPCEMMAQGLPYEAILPELLKEGGTTYNLDAACRNYVDVYKESYSPWACVSTVVTSELDALAAVMKRVNGAAKVEGFTFDTVQYYEGLSRHVFYDLEDYVRQSCADANLVEEFKAQMAKCVVSRYHTEKFYTVYGSESYIPIDYYSGVSTSAGTQSYPTVWRETAWYKDTQHNE